MLKDEFKLRYKTIPFATFERDYKKGTEKENITSLSHKHREVEIICVLNGVARIYIDSKIYDVQKGDVVIISPYLMHNATIFSDKDFAHYCICFDLCLVPDAKLKEELEKGYRQISPIISKDEIIAEKLTMCIANAYKAHKEGKDGWELAVSGNLTLVFSHLTEHKLIQKTIKGNSSDICCEIIDYIDRNYTKNITSQDAAKAFFMSKSYFCRIFKKNFGYCFQNYICLYRLEKAKVLLKTTDLPVFALAYRTGFNSTSYFVKMFKETYKTTPLKYRSSVKTKVDFN